MNSLRRSSRLQAAQVTSVSSEQLSSTSVKRRKTKGTGGGPPNTKSVPNAKKGARMRWDQLPLDVLYEIFARLSPPDLLHLARTTKGLRAIILNRSCRSVWLSALSETHIPSDDKPPACPKDLDEPAYASLMFEHICSICGIVDARTTLLMIIRKRVCVNCYGARRNFVSTNMLLTLLGHKFAGIVEDLLLPVTPDEHSDLGRTHKGSRYKAEDFKAVNAQIKVHYGRKEDMATFVAERRLVQIEHERRREGSERYEHWANWAYYHSQQARAREVSKARGTRRDAILERIAAAGFDDVVDVLRHATYLSVPRPRARSVFFEKTTFVNSPKPLTTLTWENNRGTVLKNMETLRRITTIQRRLRDLGHVIDGHPRRWGVNRMDICAFAAVAAVIHAPIPARLDVPDPALEGVDFQPLIGGYLAQIGESIAARGRVLDGLLPAGRTHAHAATFFRCGRCPAVLSGRSAVAHDCSMRKQPVVDPDRILFDQYAYALPWDHLDLKYDAEVSAVGAQLVQLAGGDPRTTTAQAMVNAAVLFKCARLPCKKARWGMTHVDATRHHLKHPGHTNHLVVTSEMAVV